MGNHRTDFVADASGVCMWIHTLNAEDMDMVVEQLELMYNEKFNFKPYRKDTIKNVKKGACGYLQGMIYEPNFANKCKIRIQISQQDKMDLFKHFGEKPNNKNPTYMNIGFAPTNPLVLRSDVKNKYPIFIISKGRYFRNRKYQAPKTAQYLDKIGVEYTLVVEEDEYDLYNKSVHSNNLDAMPNWWKKKQNENGNYGSIPVRNFVHHGVSIQYTADLGRYWILDDNIGEYFWLDNNLRYKVRSPIAFRYVEDCADNFKNVALASHQYKMFSSPTDYRNVVQYNGRAFSSILINTKIPTLNKEGDIWRGKYNEDVDLSLRMLKTDDWCTLLFTGMTCDKEQTGKAKGGNEDIYKEDANASGKLKTEALFKYHDETDFKVVHNYGRIHHKINVEKFEEKPLKMRLACDCGCDTPDFTQHKYELNYEKE
jgi:hypothetical protein